MADEQDGEWVPLDDWDHFEVNRQGDEVFLFMSSDEGDEYALVFSTEDAETIGLALAQAALDPMEESK